MEFQLQQSPARTGYGTNVTVPSFGQGTWTPTLSFGGGAVGLTYSSTQKAAWVKVGPLVTCWMRFGLSSKGSSAGAAVISGLPFEASEISHQQGAGGLMNWQGMTSSLVAMRLVMRIGVAGMREMWIYGATAATTDLSVLTDADFGNTSTISASFSYMTKNT